MCPTVTGRSDQLIVKNHLIPYSATFMYSLANAAVSKASSHQLNQPQGYARKRDEQDHDQRINIV